MSLLGFFIVLLFMFLSGAVVADQILFSVGAGSQPGADQTNSLVEIDYSFFEYQRSARSRLSLGVSYTYLRHTGDGNRVLRAYSIYPQLTLLPSSPRLEDYYFFVRALGPTYIDSNSFGERRQAEHFTFQAQVGVGRKFELGKQQLLVQVSYKHFSNAGLFSENDGFDVPLVLSLGYRY